MSESLDLRFFYAACVVNPIALIWCVNYYYRNEEKVIFQSNSNVITDNYSRKTDGAPTLVFI